MTNAPSSRLFIIKNKDWFIISLFLYSSCGRLFFFYLIYVLLRSENIFVFYENVFFFLIHYLEHYRNELPDFLREEKKKSKLNRKDEEKKLNLSMKESTFCVNQFPCSIYLKLQQQEEKKKFKDSCLKLSLKS